MSTRTGPIERQGAGGRGQGAGGREGTETAQLVQLSELPLPAGIPPHAQVPRLSSSLFVLQRETGFLGPAGS